MWVKQEALSFLRHVKPRGSETLMPWVCGNQSPVLCGAHEQDEGPLADSSGGGQPRRRDDRAQMGIVMAASGSGIPTKDGGP